MNEAIFEIRYDGNYPGEALYGILFEVFDQLPNKDRAELPIMQIPKQIRDADPNLYYQVLYRVTDNKYAFSVGTHSIVFSALKPYPGWDAW
ncbi:MAG: TIGR04255 family protein [Spirochaetaceae bacterium]|nr:TIGR04255 family protein [Spirochaetaceae bacterium]